MNTDELTGTLTTSDNLYSSIDGIKGPKGDTGATGPTGPANSLSIGTVASGTTASATITGTSPSQVLNLVLPKGDTGAKGDKGDKGDTGATGPTGEKGTDGVSVSSITQTTPSTESGGPNVVTATLRNGTTSTFNILNGAKGDTGAKGIQGVKGDTGATGPTGPANSLSIGTVASGTTASATITGTSPSQVLNLVLPKGDTGAKGDKGDKGDTGATGPTGEKGTDGVSVSSITQTTTSTESGGTNVVTATLSNGTTSTFNILNGVKGDTGAKGDKGDTGAAGTTINDTASSTSTVYSSSKVNTLLGGYLPFVNSYVANCNAWLTNGYTKTNTSTTNLPSVCTGSDRWGILFFIAENAANGTGTQMYFPIDGTYKGAIFTRSLTKMNTTPSVGTWNKLAFSSELTNFGDMKKSVYDTNADGIVDNAAKVNNALTINLSGTTYTYNGSSAISITIADGDSTSY